MHIQAKLRRDRDALLIIGTGVIAFGIWSVIKSFLFSIMHVRDDYRLFMESAGAEGAAFEMVIYHAMLVVVLTLDLWLRLYVGRSARAVGRGARCGTAFLVFACLLCVLSLFAVALDLHDVFQSSEQEFDEDPLVMLIVDTTSLVTLVEMIAAAIRVRKLTKTLAAEQV